MLLSFFLLSFVPQVMKTCEALRSEGFHSVTTIEFRLRNINYVEMQLDVPDFGSNPAAATAAPAAATTTAAAPSMQAPPPSVDSKSDSSNSGFVAANGAEAMTGPVGDGNGDGGQMVGSAAGGLEATVEAQESGGLAQGGQEEKTTTIPPGGTGRESGVTEDGGGDNNTTHTVATTGGDSSRPTENGTATKPSASLESAPGCDSTSTSISNSTSIGNKRPREEEEAGASSDSAIVRGASEASGGGGDGSGGDGGGLDAGRARNERLQPKAAIRAAEAVAGKGGARKPTKLVCAQPFPLMRGHTAFLTFATAPVARQLGTTVFADTAKAGADTLPAEIAAGCNIGQKPSVVDEEIGESKDAGGDPSHAGDGTDSGSAMDVCKREDVGGDGKGKNKEADATGSGGEGSGSRPTVSDTAASSTTTKR